MRMYPRRRLRRLWMLGLCLAVGLSGLGLTLGRGALERQLHQTLQERLAAWVPGATVGQVRLDWPGELRLEALTLPADSASEPPVLRVEEVRLRPRLWPLLRGQVELGQGHLRGVKVEAGPNGAVLLRWLAKRARPLDSGRRAQDSQPKRQGSLLSALAVSVEELEVVVGPSQGPPRMAWGPVRGDIRATPTEDGHITAELELFDRAGGWVRLSGTSGTGPKLELEAKSLALPPLPLAGDTLRMERGRLWMSVRAAPSEDGAEGTLALSARVGEAWLAGERLEADTQGVGPLELSTRATVTWNLPRHTLSLSNGRVGLGTDDAVGLWVSGKLEPGLTGPRVHLEAHAERIDFDETLVRLPAAFHPGRDALNLNGSFGVKAELSGPWGRPKEWEPKLRFDLSGLRPAQPQLPPASLLATFTHHPPEAEGRGVQVGPQNPLFVPLSQLPPALVRAVLLSEDSLFWSHQGFDIGAVWRNLHRAPEPGGVLRGGSTISQQLAKNLFLSRERTYARKVREAFWTLALEAALPKERLLELYFNLIEWGPGLYGIGEAAQHYFAKDARALSIKESAFLASIIPSPTRYHGYCSRGAITDAWERQLEQLLDKMAAAQDLTPDELRGAKAEVLRFHHPHPAISR